MIFQLSEGAYWFGFFLIILPFLGLVERPLPIPATIEEDFNARYRANAHPAE